MNYIDLLAYMRKLMQYIHLESKLLEKTMGLSIPQLLTLSFLNEANDYRSNQSKIGEYLALNPSTVTGIVSRLEKKGLVARVPDDKDRRASIVVITRDGKSIEEKSLHFMSEKFEAKVNSDQSASRESIARSFEEIIAFINVMNAEVKEVLEEIEDENE